MSIKRIRLHEPFRDSTVALDMITDLATTSTFCSRCQETAFNALRKIFFPNKVSSSNRPVRYVVGDIFKAIQQEESCLLCKFFVETLQLRGGTFLIYDQADARQTNISLVLDCQPWFSTAGIATDLQCSEFCWLQIGAEVEGPRICLSLSELAKGEVSSQSQAGRISPKRREPIEAYNGNCDYQLILKWLEKCDRYHRSCAPYETIMPKDLMLIDVNTRRLVSYEAGARYLTLSYVWGKGFSQQQYYVMPNMDNLSSEGSRLANRTIPLVLPQTIEDAIQITRKIGQRYLWVDLLCIDQADKIGKQDQIDAMDRIYASSWLTLVCVDGSDAMYGLPGGSRNMIQTKQPSVLTPIGRLMATYIHSHWAQNGRSEWDQRAWTLQERLLSQRCLFFADTYISMVCQDEVFHELIEANIVDPEKKLVMDNQYFRKDGSSIDLNSGEWDFDTYGNLVSVFTGRGLTNQDDVHNACQGSLNRMALKTGCAFHFGLPKNDLLQGLLWISHYECVLSRRSGFPTWSWLGWVGRSGYPYWLHLQNKDDRTHNINENQLRRLKKSTVDFNQKNGREWAEIVHNDTMTAPVLQLKTSILHCNTQLASKSAVNRRLEEARSDQWRLLRRDGHAITNRVGEYQDFESSSVSFRVHPDQSRKIQKLKNQVDLIFIKYWPCIWDSKKPLQDVVSALVTVKDQQGSYHRLASVVLSADDWLQGERKDDIVTLI